MAYNSVDNVADKKGNKLEIGREIYLAEKLVESMEDYWVLLMVYKVAAEMEQNKVAKMVNLTAPMKVWTMVALMVLFVVADLAETMENEKGKWRVENLVSMTVTC